jgi:hypothetical protein
MTVERAADEGQMGAIAFVELKRRVRREFLARTIS